MRTIIPFTKPTVLNSEIKYIKKAINSEFGISDNGFYSRRVADYLKELFSSEDVLLTSSCTHALEIIAMLLNLEIGDEIIMPSFTFVSTANAFVIHGGKPVFVDINPETMNIDESIIEKAITKKTRAILVMHYAGVSCDMNKVLSITKKHNLILIEDAAQALYSEYKRKLLGTFGDFSTFSFHSTKNFSCGEGGALIINNKKYVNRASIIKDKGTNRKDFLNKIISKYTWVDIGSSFVMSELNAAHLYSQLINSNKI